MNTGMRKDAKSEFQKDFFKLMNNSVFGKTMENIWNHRDIKLVTRDKKKKKSFRTELSNNKKHFSENLLAIEMKKTKVKMNKPIYFGMITSSQNMKTQENYVTRILIALFLLLKLRFLQRYC